MKKTTKKTVKKVNKTKSVELNENEYGLISDELILPKLDIDLIDKVMIFLGYKKLRAANYKYYAQTSKNKRKYKVSELEQLFK